MTRLATGGASRAVTAAAQAMFLGITGLAMATLSQRVGQAQPVPSGPRTEDRMDTSGRRTVSPNQLTTIRPNNLSNLRLPIHYKFTMVGDDIAVMDGGRVFMWMRPDLNNRDQQSGIVRGLSIYSGDGAPLGYATEEVVPGRRSVLFVPSNSQEAACEFSREGDGIWRVYAKPTGGDKPVNVATMVGWQVVLGDGSDTNAELLFTARPQRNGINGTEVTDEVKKKVLGPAAHGPQPEVIVDGVPSEAALQLWAVLLISSRDSARVEERGGTGAGPGGPVPVPVNNGGNFPAGPTGNVGVFPGARYPGPYPGTGVPPAATGGGYYGGYGTGGAYGAGGYPVGASGPGAPTVISVGGSRGGWGYGGARGGPPSGGAVTVVIPDKNNPSGDNRVRVSGGVYGPRGGISVSNIPIGRGPPKDIDW